MSIPLLLTKICEFTQTGRQASIHSSFDAEQDYITGSIFITISTHLIHPFNPTISERV